MESWRVAMLGDGGTNKTQLATQFTLGVGCETYDPTIEDAYLKKLIVDGKMCLIYVIDTAGQEEYAVLRDQWLREGQGFVIVYSIRKRSTFDRLGVFLGQIERLKKTRPVFILVGNECDRTYEREVSKKEGLDLSRQYGCLFMEVSSRNGYNVELMFMSLIRSLRAATQTPEEITNSAVGNGITKPQIMQRLLFNITRGLRPVGRLFIGQAEGGPVPSSTLAASEEKTPEKHIDSSSEVHTSLSVAIGRNLKIYQNILNLLQEELRKRRNVDNQLLQDPPAYPESDSSSTNDIVAILVQSRQYRDKILQILSTCGVSGHGALRNALEQDENYVSVLMREVLSSAENITSVRSLDPQGAEQFMVLLQDLMDRSSSWMLDDEQILHTAQRLLVKLAQMSGTFAPSLFIDDVKKPIATSCGAFADIYRAQRLTGKEVALKKLRVFQVHERAKIHNVLCNEALLWKQLEHQHILPFIGLDAGTFPGFICMVSPWMIHGTILQHIKNTNPSAGDMGRYVSQIAQGIEYLHSRNIVHGDLRGGNIFVDEGWGIRVADFGLSVFSDATMESNSGNSRGTLRWMAPELHFPKHFGLDGFRQTYASDIYAFACTCLEIYTLSPPFSHIRHEMGVVTEVVKGGRPSKPDAGSGCVISDVVWDVIETCWSQQPTDRPDAGEIVEQLMMFLIVL